MTPQGRSAMPTLRQYEYFLAVAAELNFHRAAERACVAQSALSMQIKAMEDEIGLRLFIRDNRNVRLSEAGRLLLPEANALVRQAQRTAELARNVARGAIGKLDIGMVPSTAFTGVIASTIHRFRTAAPDVNIVWHELLMDAQLDELLAGRLDLGFLRLPWEGADLRFCTRVLHREKILLAVPEDDPAASSGRVALVELRDRRFIMSPLPATMGLSASVHLLCRKAGFAPDVVMTSRQFPVMLNLVGAGMGVAFVPESVAAIRIPGIALLELDDPEAFTEIALIYRSESAALPVRKFIESIETQGPGQCP